MKQFKKCPICGEKEKVKLMYLNNETNELNVWDDSIGNVYTWFHCYECDGDFYCDMPVHTPENMIEWWNTRKPMERIVKKMGASSIMLATSKEYWENPQKGGNTMEVIPIQDAIEIVKEEMEGV